MSPLKATPTHSTVFALQASLLSFLPFGIYPLQRQEEIARLPPVQSPSYNCFHHRLPLLLSPLSSPLALEQLEISSWGVEHNASEMSEEEECSLKKNIHVHVDHRWTPRSTSLE